MIEDKWLTDALFTTVNTKADLRKVKSGVSGDFLSSSLSKIINTTRINNLAFQAWSARASERKSTLVFCVDVDHVHGLTTTFRENGIDARSIVGADLIRDRDATLDAFKRQDFPVLLNCAIFTEGTDIPNIDCVLLARPTKSRNLLVQMIGRGMRLSDGKENCHVIDLVSSLETGIVSTPTLFGLDPAEIVKEATIDDMKRLRENKLNSIGLHGSPHPNSDGAEPGTASLVFTDYDSVQDLIEDTSGERHIRAISRLAWVQVDRDRYILCAEEGSYLTVEMADDDRYEVRYTARIRPASSVPGKRLAPFARPRILARLPTLSDAVHSADTFATSSFAWKFVAVNQPWRKAPATEGQLEFLNKYRDEDSQLTEDDVTKGKAGDMITKIKFGAKGRFDRIKAVVKKQSKEEEKRVEHRRSVEREMVQVGRLEA